MPTYDLLIDHPGAQPVIVFGFSDTSAEEFVREVLRADYAGEIDRVVLGARVAMMAWAGGRIVV